MRRYVDIHIPEFSKDRHRWDTKSNCLFVRHGKIWSFSYYYEEIKNLADADTPRIKTPFLLSEKIYNIILDQLESLNDGKKPHDKTEDLERRVALLESTVACLVNRIRNQPSGDNP